MKIDFSEGEDNIAEFEDFNINFNIFYEFYVI